jgi:hypothetical protein
LPVEVIPEVLAFFDRQRTRFLTDAASIQVGLEEAFGRRLGNGD